MEPSGDADSLLDALFDEMEPWATRNGFQRLSNSFYMDRQYFEAHPDLLRTGELPAEWEVMAVATDVHERHLIVRTGVGRWAMLHVGSIRLIGDVTVSPVLCRQSLGLLVNHILRTHFGATETLRRAMINLLGQCPLGEGEHAERVLTALGGYVYIPWSAYTNDTSIQPLS